MAVVLAAGKGTRMHSQERPKVMQELLGEPMLHYVYQALEPVFGQDVLTVVGFGADLVRKAFPGRTAGMVVQAEQRGTGHALQTAWPELMTRGADACLVVNGDAPLLDSRHITQLLDQCRAAGADLGFASILVRGPNTYGRVLRDAGGRVTGIVEAKDFDPARHGPVSGEVNAGLYYFRLSAIGPLLSRLTDGNAAGEYYLTDLIGLAAAEGLTLLAVPCGEDPGLMGVDTPAALVAAEEGLRARLVAHWLGQGAIIRQGASVRIGPKVTIAPGADLTGPCELLGETKVKARVRIGSQTVVIDSTLAEDVVVHSFSHLDGAVVGPGASVGPYARLRPGAELKEKARVGNFVEMKKAVLGPGAKASHLTYLGDAEIGAGANIGAGTITCNYDGKHKHRTVIGEGAFIGSNTALVAPVTVGEGALVGAGSVITKDVAPGKLAVARARQVELKRKS
jgi:bifunctional UDP-N-acetylglucosamine pyrophosphorylase/glucosamine-1-phosphate N-acetyltransferase